jgi:hypothetical protein
LGLTIKHHGFHNGDNKIVFSVKSIGKEEKRKKGKGKKEKRKKKKKQNKRQKKKG